MNFMDQIEARAKSNRKRIVLPETMDSRVLEAAEILSQEEICDVILIGKKEEMEQDYDLSKVTIINPMTSSITDTLTQGLYDLRKSKGLSLEESKDLLLTNYMYYACMLVKVGLADGVVSGACHSTSETLRPALQIIKTKETVPFVSAFFCMDVPNCSYGLNGLFLFSDSGLIQNPTSEELSIIAECSASSFQQLTREKPVVAFLSHSTLGSASHTDVDKVKNAVSIIKSKNPPYLVDGEFQLDAAIVPEVAVSKAPNNPVAGKANVLIFPDLDAGNIGYKLVERLAKAKAYGPITQGMAAPINDLSRGCSVSDIVGVAAITCVQAQNNQ